MAKKQVGQVLLDILNKVPDPDKVGKLLEAENLLKLLLIYGRDKETVRQELQGGKLPGEFLLELLEQEPDADRLLAQLGITDVKSGEKRAAPPVSSVPTPPVSTGMGGNKRGNLLGKYAQIVAIAIVACTAVLPALILAGFLPNGSLSYQTATIIALIGGAIAGAIADPFAIFSWKGMIVGIVYNLGALWATIFYTEYRTSILRIELAIPLLLGGIPAVIVFFLLSKLGKVATPH